MSESNLNAARLTGVKRVQKGTRSKKILLVFVKKFKIIIFLINVHQNQNLLQLELVLVTGVEGVVQRRLQVNIYIFF